MQLLRTVFPLLLAIGTAMAIDRFTEARGLLPPNFRFGSGGADRLAGGLGALRPLVLRSAAMGTIALVLWLGVFGPIGLLGLPQSAPTQPPATSALFVLHAIFAAGLAAWYLLGFAGSGRDPLTEWIRQVGLATPRLGREIGIGLAAGLVGWLGVIAVLFGVAALLYALGAEEALPTQAPQMITWVVALPFGVRLALSLSAGVFEELFFRGFLQPRVGAVLSGALFVLAHLSYEQPFLLIGVALLSALFAFLVRWRQSVWAAIVAHAVFDGVQLLIVIPRALELLEEDRTGLVAYLACRLSGV